MSGRSGGPAFDAPALALLGAALAALDAACLVVGMDDEVVLVTPAASRLLGLSPGLPAGVRLKELRVCDHVPGLRPLVDRVRRDGGPGRLPGVALSQGAGSGDVDAAPLEGHRGRRIGVLVTFRVGDGPDAATEAFQVEPAAALIEDAEAAQPSDARRNDALAAIAHELRGPLGAILNAVQVVARRIGDDATARHALEIAERQVRHQARLLDDVVDVWGVTQDRVDLRRETLDLAGVVRRAVEIVRPLAERRAQRLALELPDAAVPVVGDGVRLVQVVRNLLDNAVKYTGPGGRVEVRLAADAGRAVLTVVDSGAGIAPAMLPRVFEPFVRGDTSATRRAGGLGVGLAIVKRLVELHEGTVTARSAGEGQGSQFEVQLALAPAAPAPAGEEERAARQTLRVLIVDDDGDSRHALRALLESDGHRVQEAADGRTGVARAVVWAPDVVLLDIALPGVDGHEVARRIRRRLGRAIRLVALTAYDGEAARRAAVDAGFDAFVVKPAAPAELSRALMPS